jgi:DNA-directed RNA polymerase specialized sigma subunit
MRNCLSFDENWMTPKGVISDSSQNSNTNHIKALLMVQKDVIQEVLSDREKLIVNYCICKEYRQNAVAKMLEVHPSAVNKSLKNALRKMRRYIIICDKVLTYYEKECKKYEEI